MSGRDELETMLDLVTTRAAACFGAENYGLETGKQADLVVFDAPTPVDVVRTLAARRWVISRGRVAAETEPANSRVHWNGHEEPVRFLV